MLTQPITLTKRQLIEALCERPGVSPLLLQIVAKHHLARRIRGGQYRSVGHTHRLVKADYGVVTERQVRRAIKILKDWKICTD